MLIKPASRYMKKYGTSYYYATLFFPRTMKEKVMTLYKFVRIPDLVVDNKNISDDDARAKLNAMRDEREIAYNQQDSHHTVRWDAVSLFHDSKIPFELSRTFWQAMLQDAEKKTYDTYSELQDYMNGSAMVVGEMMCHIMWVTDEQTMHYAKKLGEAMQMTNFLRDVKEDWLEFGRIYMPEEWLHKYSLSYRHIKDFCYSDCVNDQRPVFMAYCIQHCDALYEEARLWLKHLPPRSQKAIYMSLKLYQQILRKIEHTQYNIFAKSARTNWQDKWIVIAKSLWKGM